MQLKTKRDACLYVVSALADADLRNRILEIEDFIGLENYKMKSVDDFIKLLNKDLEPRDLSRVVCEFIELTIKNKIDVNCIDLMTLAEMAE